MSLLNYTKMPFSFHDGWDKVGVVHPSVLRTFLLLVLPFSLIPPAMLLYAGSHHASVYLMDATFSRWQEVALVFLIAELLTVPLMGWILQSIASVHKMSVDFKDTFLLAAIVAVPMWLSSLGFGESALRHHRQRLETEIGRRHAQGRRCNAGEWLAAAISS